MREAVTDVYMPQQSFVAAFVIGADAVLFADILDQVKEMIHWFRLHRAMLDIDQFMGVLTIISCQNTIAAVWMFDRKLRLVAIIQGMLSADNRFNDFRVELADMLQRLFDNVFFGRELIVVTQVLPLASAADLKNGAGRLIAMLGRRDQAMHFGFCKIFAHIEQLDFDHVSGRDAIDKNWWSEAFSDALATGCERLDCDCVPLPFRQVVSSVCF